MMLSTPIKRFSYAGLLLCSLPLSAQTYTQSNFGGTGLMQMPTARMQPEGEFSAAYNHNDIYDFYTISVQLFPWLETTVRYAQTHDMLYSNDPSFSGNTKHTDKSFDAKIRLWEESYWLPQVSLGFQDIGGTGLFDGEYLAANKRWGPLDFTLGIGWGYLGNRGNVHGDKALSSDCGRDTDYKGNGGSFDVNRMFTGCMALFGGIEYQTPYKPLTLKIEYEGNDYRSDYPVTAGKITIPQSTPWNFGMNYALTDWASVRLSYERGNSVNLGLRLHSNFSDIKPLWLDEPKPAYAPSTPRTEMSNEEWQALTQDIARVSGYQSVRVYQSDTAVTVMGEQKRYRDRQEGYDRLARVVLNSGIDTEQIRIIETRNQQPLTEVIIDSDKAHQVLNQAYINGKISDAVEIRDPSPAIGHQHTQQDKPWQLGLSPVLQQSFGGSESFYLFAIGARADASWRLNDHWLLSGSLYGNIYDNYDKFNYTVPPDGTDLKRVRTLSREYLEDTIRLNHAQLTYLDYVGQGIYNQFYGGYLESMFAGVGSEWLYRPLDKHWAVGIDLNYVAQREAGSVFGIYRDEVHYDNTINHYYRVQTGTATGHATLYWQPQFWSLFDNSLLKVSAGRYLSEDVGVTVDFSKQFNSGVIVGAFATKTDLSADEFGEGSFTKGFYISVPLEMMTAKHNTNRAAISWMPIQRDGGQMLSRQHRLFEMTDARSPWFERAPIK
ncbi:TPA: YjbH domain-containing protein [Vibrio cholerae]